MADEKVEKGAARRVSLQGAIEALQLANEYGLVHLTIYNQYIHLQVTGCCLVFYYTNYICRYLSRIWPTRLWQVQIKIFSGQVTTQMDRGFHPIWVIIWREINQPLTSLGNKSSLCENFIDLKSRQVLDDQDVRHGNGGLLRLLRGEVRLTPTLRGVEGLGLLEIDLRRRHLAHRAARQGYDDLVALPLELLDVHLGAVLEDDGLANAI